MKKTEEEIDQLHEITMEGLYEVFEDEMDAFFKFKEAALEVMGFGKMTFPFSTRYDCAMEHIDKSLDVIEKNISDHIITQLEIILKERNKISEYTNSESEILKIKFSEKIRQEIIEKRLL